MKDIPQRLYHYCSIESFFNIIRSKSIWLSNSNQMNDSSENIWVENYFSFIKSFFADPKYEKFLKSSFDMYKWNSNPPYIFCLSASKDLLSQWRGYSQDGKGVSIGFNTKTLKIQQEIPAPNVYAHNTVGLAKVEYSNLTHKKEILEICNYIKERFDNPKTQMDNHLVLSLDFSSILVDWSLVLKNTSFKEEKEYRIIHTPTDTYEEELQGLSNLQFRSAEDRIITYFSYNFTSDFNSNLIDEIVLGPKCKINIEEMTQFLKHNGLENTRIINSKSTYR